MIIFRTSASPPVRPQSPTNCDRKKTREKCWTLTVAIFFSSLATCCPSKSVSFSLLPVVDAKQSPVDGKKNHQRAGREGGEFSCVTVNRLGRVRGKRRNRLRRPRQESPGFIGHLLEYNSSLTPKLVARSRIGRIANLTLRRWTNLAVFNSSEDMLS